MKITVDVDCTPEEARRAIGLPDMAPIHAMFLDKIKDMMAHGVSPEMVEMMMRSWSPIGEASMAAWRQMIGQMTGIGKE